MSTSICWPRFGAKVMNGLVLLGLLAGPAQVLAETEPYAMPGETRLVKFQFDPNRSYTILTRPGTTTDIELAPDEEFVAIAMGDTVQWQTDRARQHIFVKPVRAGLFTSATIVTDQRAYQLTLRSSPPDGAWYQRVQWQYPNMILLHHEREEQRKAVTKKVEEEAQQAREVRQLGVLNDIEALNFDYKIKGDAEFRPSQVIDDGRFTWIRLPADSAVTPALFVREGRGDFALTNYSVKGQYLVVQQTFESAILKLGDQTVSIERKS